MGCTVSTVPPRYTWWDYLLYTIKRRSLFDSQEKIWISDRKRHCGPRHASVGLHSRTMKSLTWLVLTWRDENGIVGSSSRRSDFRNLVAKHPPFPLISSRWAPAPDWVLTSRAFDPQDCWQHELPSAASRCETLDSQTRTLQLHPPCTWETTTHHTQYKHDTRTDTHKTLTRTIPSAQCSDIQSERLNTSACTQRQ